MKKKKNPINKKENECFQFTVTVALIIKPFINKYNCEGINYPSEKNDYKKIEKNNLKTALTAFYAINEGWHYIAVKKFYHY